MRYLFIVLFLSSCSASWHLQKAIEKNPDLLKVHEFVVDTLIVTDSFMRVDSFTLKEVDTFISDSGKVKITIYRYKDRFTIKQEIKRDTIHLTKTIKCPPSVIQMKDSEKMKNYMLYSFLSGCLITLILITIYYGQKMGNAK
jgi:hypothetical protein